MRCLVVLVLALGLLAAPLSVSAQVSDKEEAAESADTSKAATGLQRWHPDAFVDPATGESVAAESDSNFQIQYASQSPESSPKISKRKKRIILGVVIPTVALGIGLGIGAGVVMSNWN